MGRKKITTKSIVLALVLVVALGIGGISAYLTDIESKNNTFIYGAVNVVLQEPSWNPDKAIAVVPDYPIAKDPHVINDGEVDVFVFLEVNIPYANVRTSNSDGSMNAAANTQLFNYTVNSGWVQVGNVKNDTENNQYIYLYAYGTSSAMTALAAGDKTGALFDSVKMANIIETEALEGATEKIMISAFAIQAASLGESQNIKDPVGVWDIVSAQKSYDAGTLVFKPDGRACLYGDNNEVVATYTGWDTGVFYSSSGVPWHDNFADITTVIIEDGVSPASTQYWFTNCTGLTSVTIGDGLTSIDSYAFDGCTGLINVTISDSVTNIKKSAFYGCSSLKSVTIPGSVAEIGVGAFRNCTGLTSVTIGVGVTSIGQSAFRDCSNLTSVTIPDSVTEILGHAFDGCSSLKSITIPGSVTEITSYAFYECSSLKSVTFVNTIGWKAGTTSVDVSNASTAASYLTSKYYKNSWTRS